MFTTSGTYPWSFVTQIYHNVQPSHGGDRTIFEVMTSTLPQEILDSVAFLLETTFYHTYKWKVHNGKIEIISFVVKFRSYPPLNVNFDV